MSEVKAYAKPPPLVELALGAVMTVLKKPTTWDEIKKALGDANFLLTLLKFDKDQLVRGQSEGAQDSLEDTTNVAESSFIILLCYYNV
jgi:hypothetical protein